MKRLGLFVVAFILLFSISCGEKTPATQTLPPQQPSEPAETPAPAQPSYPATTPSLTETVTPVTLPNMLFIKPATWTQLIVIGTGEDISGVPGNEEQYVAAWLSNDGTVDISNTAVSLHIDGTFVKNLEISESLPAGQGVRVCACLKDLKDVVSLESGDHEFSFFADYDDAIKESDESDNKVTATVFVPSLVVAGPDIKPCPVDGTASIVVDNKDKGYKDIRIRAGVTNTGTLEATDVVVELQRGTKTLYQWSLEKLGVSEKVILEVTIGEILKNSSMTACFTSLTLHCKVLSGNAETDLVNNSQTVDNLKVALLPVPGSTSPSATGKKIKESIENNTWYTDKNSQELLEIAKELFKSVYPYWNNLRIYILPFDEFNTRLAEKRGKTEAEIASIKNSLASDRMRGKSYSEGYIQGASIFFREGTFVQLMPNFLWELGGLLYAQKNYTSYRTTFNVGGVGLAGNLFEAYGIAVMREDQGLDSLFSVSASLSDTIRSSIGGVDITSTNLRRIWAIAVEKGYPEGGLPSKAYFDAYAEFTGKNDPLAYLEELDNQGKLLDKGAIANAIYWRPVDKNPTMLTEEIVEKIDPGKTQLSLDALLIAQPFSEFP